MQLFYFVYVYRGTIIIISSSSTIIIWFTIIYWVVWNIFQYFQISFIKYEKARQFCVSKWNQSTPGGQQEVRVPEKCAYVGVSEKTW